MALLPLLNHFHQLEEFAVKRNEAIHYSHRVPDFHPAWHGEKTTHRVGSAVPSIMYCPLIEAGGDGVVLFEGDKQGWQGRLVVKPEFEEFPRLLERKPREALDAPQPARTTS